MAYFPPHLRRTNVSDSNSELPQRSPSQSHLNLTLQEIDNYFNPVQKGDDQDEVGTQDTTLKDRGKTLHDSAETPNDLAYVVLYDGANPRWGERPDHLHEV